MNAKAPSKTDEKVMDAPAVPEKPKVVPVRNISTKSVYKKDKRALQLQVEAGQTGPIMQVMGQVYKYKARPSDYDRDIVAFSGAFVAKNLETGELFTADEAYFPQIFTDELAAAVNKLEDGEALNIKTEISIFPSTKSTLGYSFVAKDIKPPEAFKQQQAIVDQLLKGF